MRRPRREARDRGSRRRVGARSPSCDWRTAATVFDDVEEARLVDELHGDFTPFVVTVDDAPHVIVAGVSRAEQVLVERADEVARLCHVKNGVWLSARCPSRPASGSPPPGATRTGRELHRSTSPSL